jgi:hypothetical protein
MSTLTSASTFTEVQAAYFTNATYLEDASVTKAKAFITACMFLLEMKPRSLSHDGASIDFDFKLIENLMNAAKDYVSINQTIDGCPSRVTVKSFKNFRSF